MAVVSQQVLSIRNLLQIPEDDEALFNDPPLDHVIEDIYNDIDREDDNCNDNDDTGSDDVLFEDNSSSDTGESFYTAAIANSSDTGQDHKVVVYNISSSPTQSRRTRGNGPVYLDDSVDYASTDVTVDNESVMTGTTNITCGGPVDMDMIRFTKTTKIPGPDPIPAAASFLRHSSSSSSSSRAATSRYDASSSFTAAGTHLCSRLKLVQ